jgi:hypothetical protein
VNQVKRKIKWICFSAFVVLWLCLASCGFTVGEWRSACCGTVEFPEIVGTSTGKDSHQYLIVRYEIPIDQKANESMFFKEFYASAYVPIPFDNRQIPDRYKYDGPRKSVEDLKTSLPVTIFRFGKEDWIIGEQLASSPNFCPANKDGAKVYSSSFIIDSWLDGAWVIPFWNQYPFKETAKHSQGYDDFYNNKPQDLLKDSENMNPDFELMLLPTEQPRPWRYQSKAIGMAIVRTPVNLILDITVTPCCIAFFMYCRMTGNVWW